VSENPVRDEPPLADRWSLPVDLVALRARDGWRDQLAWPCSYRAIRQIQEGLFERTLSLVETIDDPALRRVAAVAAPRLDNFMRRLGWLGLHVDAAAAAGLELGASCVFLDAIQNPDAAAAERLAEAQSATTLSRVAHAKAKQAARSVLWSRSPWRALGALVSPSATAISHNALMRAAVADSGAPIGFSYAEDILSRAQAELRHAPDGDVDALARMASEAFLAYYQTDHAMWGRMARLVESFASRLLRNVAADLAALARSRALPTTVWTGSFGNYAARAIVTEVCRRGGHVTWFDHGGSISMIDEDRSLEFTEMIAQDVCVMPSRRTAALMRGRVPRLLLRPEQTPEFTARAADPTFTRAAQMVGRPTVRRPAVTYVTTIYQGTRQHYPPLLPDPIYVDLHLRVVDSLSRLPIDLRFRPHPEINLRSGAHPVEGRCAFDLRPFVEVLRDTDVFVFDYPQSTTFWEATCSDRRVVLIDLGISRFNATVREVIERRCQVLTPAWNGRNLPEIDEEALAEAVCGAAMGGDPSDMRQLLVA
jgi:hypothetical protein